MDLKQVPKTLIFTIFKSYKNFHIQNTQVLFTIIGYIVYLCLSREKLYVTYSRRYIMQDTTSLLYCFLEFVLIYRIITDVRRDILSTLDIKNGL